MRCQNYKCTVDIHYPSLFLMIIAVLGFIWGNVTRFCFFFVFFPHDTSKLSRALQSRSRAYTWQKACYSLPNSQNHRVTTRPTSLYRSEFRGSLPVYSKYLFSLNACFRWNSSFDYGLYSRKYHTLLPLIYSPMLVIATTSRFLCSKCGRVLSRKSWAHRGRNY